MRKFKLLICDIDGTLVPTGGAAKDLTEAAVTMAKKVQSEGKLISLATGRLFKAQADEIASRLGITTPIIVDGGARIVHPETGETIWSHAMRVDEVKQIYDIIIKHSPDEGLILGPYQGWEAGNLGELTINTVPEEKSIIHVLQISNDPAVKIANEINSSQTDIVAHVTSNWQAEGLMNIDIVHQDATKLHAVERLIEMVEPTKEETIVMGDGTNDVPLFSASGFSVAVGDAHEDVLAMADYIGPDQKDDPLTHVIERFMKD